MVVITKPALLKIQNILRNTSIHSTDWGKNGIYLWTTDSHFVERNESLDLDKVNEVKNVYDDT